MSAYLIKEDTEAVKSLENIFFRDGNIVPVPYDVLKEFSEQQLSYFCLLHGLYQLPTVELIEFLKSEIGDRPAIEIGAGNGCIGRALGIKMTDSFIQERQDIKDFYEMMKQPTVKYGKDVEKLEANEAVLKYAPEVVLGCWITQKYKPWMSLYPNIQASVHGVDELLMFNLGIKKYIIVGNEKVHGIKDILILIPHEKKSFPWLVSRQIEKESNRIYIIDLKE